MIGAAGDAPFFGGGVGGAVASPGPFDLVPVEVEGQDNQYKVVNRYLYFGRVLLTDPDGEETLFTLPPNTEWTLNAVVTHTTSGDPQLTVEKSPYLPGTPGSDMDRTYIALWHNRSRGSSPGSGHEMLDLRRVPVVAAYLPA